MDFVTIVFNNEIEINLLKLQAMSIKYVDENLINNLYIIYNDIGVFDIDDVVKYYPENIRKRVIVLYNIEVHDYFKNKKSSWHNQQLLKLLITNKVKSNYYLVLDAKNHFIRNVNYNDYFDAENKPRLFTHHPGSMIEYYYRCLQYYKVEDPYDFKNTHKLNKLLTTTPFLMCKSDVLEMICYIEDTEKEEFCLFFSKNTCNFTEFYLYTTYLIYKKKIDEYCLTPKNFTSFMGANAPWNSIDNICLPVLQNNHVCFGLHRGLLTFLDETGKHKILMFYANFYDETICAFIKRNIFNLIQ